MAEKPTLLIVDDEKPTREGLRAALEERYDVYIAEDAKTAMDLLEHENFVVMLTDFRLPGEDGLKLIGRAKSLAKPPICILMTAYGSEEIAVEAMKRGAVDYFLKDRIARLGQSVRQALFQKQLRGERRRAEGASQNQLQELQRWQEAMLDREERIIELKQEVNDLLGQLKQPNRYFNPAEP